MRVVMDMIYDVAHFVFYFLFKPLFRFKVVGEENVPKEGPVIIACNHASNLDPVIVGVAMWRRVNFMAKEELFTTPAVSFFLRSWRSFPISRERLDKTMLKTILGKLKDGEALGVFPEGTRGDGDNFLPVKPGIGMIVSMSRAPVIPVYIKGSYLTLAKAHKKLRFVPIKIVFGSPVDFSGVAGGKGTERYQAIADEVMSAIAKLKEQYR
ncbi:MAG TPA: lysophospholipid acyltransferase family protein [Nitrospirota bacterium]|jgi:1-acyl-sn-glycerol-3-phosphate acyltransferase